MTTETFADYVAQQDARNTIQLNVRKWTLMLCDALRQNYINYSIDSHEKSIYLADAGDSFSTNYHQSYIDALKNGECDYDFFIVEGRKYLKIVMNAQGSKSVHAFVDKKTGEVYKSASFKAPAKGVRYDLRLIKDREWLLENADWAGSYLYMKCLRGQLMTKTEFRNNPLDVPDFKIKDEFKDLDYYEAYRAVYVDKKKVIELSLIHI